MRAAHYLLGLPLQNLLGGPGLTQLCTHTDQQIVESALSTPIASPPRSPLHKHTSVAGGVERPQVAAERIHLTSGLVARKERGVQRVSWSINHHHHHYHHHHRRRRRHHHHYHHRHRHRHRYSYAVWSCTCTHLRVRHPLLVKGTEQPCTRGQKRQLSWLWLRCTIPYTYADHHTCDALAGIRLRRRELLYGALVQLVDL
jgi:hypothetical protein